MSKTSGAPRRNKGTGRGKSRKLVVSTTGFSMGEQIIAAGVMRVLASLTRRLARSG